MGDPTTVDDVRRALEDERAKLLARQQEQQPVEDGKSIHNLQRSESGMDVAAQQATQRSERLGRIDQTDDRLAKVDGALERIERGEFGTCELCGDAIDDGRLLSLPTTQRCLDCAEEASA